MTDQIGKVVSVHIGAAGTLEKVACAEIEMALDGVVGDRHRGLSRECWEGDKQPEGTARRNERMWSAISAEDMAAIGETMDVAEPLLASSLGVNLCIEGIANLSRLPRGTLLTFSSGVVLMVEEYNPPCSDMGEKLAGMHTTNSGEALDNSAFSKAAKFSRGLIGVVVLAGTISVGDEVQAAAESLPKWLRT
jgi:MOSC domain-containing protein YiiM